MDMIFLQNGTDLDNIKAEWRALARPLERLVGAPEVGFAYSVGDRTES